MRCFLLVGFLGIVLLGAVFPAVAQTPAGDILRGEADFLRGAGAFNLNTARANSINVDTVIKWKADLRKDFEFRQSNQARFAAKEKNRLEDIQQRLRERQRQLRLNPTNEDILSGEALNVLLYDLTDPEITSARWDSKSVPLPKDVSVKNLIFSFSAGSGSSKGSKALSRGVIALSRLDLEGKWPTVMKFAALDNERAAYEKAYVKVRDQILNDRFTLDAVKEMDQSLDTLELKVKTAVEKDERNYQREALQFVKDLKDATRMFDASTVEYAKEILIDTKEHDATSVAELVAFTLKYRLQFAKAGTGTTAPILYKQLYEALHRQLKEFGLEQRELVGSVFRENSVWMSPDGKMKFTVKSVGDGKFSALFEFGGGNFLREIKGVAQNNSVSWQSKDVKPIKGNTQGHDNYGVISHAENGYRIDFEFSGGPNNDPVKRYVLQLK